MATMLALKTITLIAALTAAVPTLNTRQVSCAPFHLITVRGSNEPQGDGGSTLAPLVTQIESQITGADDEDLGYPATIIDPIYNDSEGQGTEALTALLAQYATQCPDSKIALLGYSQGAQVILDTLCGTSSLLFKWTRPETNQAVIRMLSSAVVFGDPSHVEDEPYNQGTGTDDGDFPRLNPKGCDPFENIVQSYCNDGDPFCDRGLDLSAHVDGAYDRSSGAQAVQFVVSKYRGS